MTKQLDVLPQQGRHPVHPAVDEVNQLAGARLNAARQYEMALIATKRAIRIEPTSRELWHNLGTYYFNIREYAEAEAAYLRALVIDPDYVLSHCHLGMVYGATRYFDKAEECFAIAEALAAEQGLMTEAMAIKWDRSLLRLRRGDYEQGLADYEIRIPYKMNTNYPKYSFPYWHGSVPLKGKIVYVCGEQGIGDTIMFSRFLPWLGEQGCKKIYMLVTAGMTNLLWGYRDIVEFIPLDVPIPNADYAISLASLAHFSGVRVDTIPPDPGKIGWRVKTYAKEPGFKLPEPGGPKPFRVGIAWAGNPAMERNAERCIPFKVIARAAENPRVWVHSFQCGDGVSDIYEFGADELVYDLSDRLMKGGLVATGAALLQMDLVITACTSIAHLAGVLGVPCWVMLCYDAYWPWLIDRADSPWYPSVKLFRQIVPDNWVWVMNDVMKELDQLVAEKEI